jgi:hypothetical protein
LGNGDGTFQLPVNYPVGDGPQSVAVGDFNHDGKLDLAVANPPEQQRKCATGKRGRNFSAGNELHNS